MKPRIGCKPNHFEIPRKKLAPTMLLHKNGANRIIALKFGG
jgi:hypothetical protein